MEAGIIHGLYKVPFRGDSLQMGAEACLPLIAYLSLGSLLQLLASNLALGLSLRGPKVHRAGHRRVVARSAAAEFRNHSTQLAVGVTSAPDSIQSNSTTLLCKKSRSANTSLLFAVPIKRILVVALAAASGITMFR